MGGNKKTLSFQFVHVNQTICYKFIIHNKQGHPASHTAFPKYREFKGMGVAGLVYSRKHFNVMVLFQSTNNSCTDSL